MTTRRWTRSCRSGIGPPANRRTPSSASLTCPAPFPAGLQTGGGASLPCGGAAPQIRVAASPAGSADERERFDAVTGGRHSGVPRVITRRHSPTSGGDLTVWIRSLGAVVALALVVATPLAAWAFVFQTGETVTAAEGLSDDLYAAGQTVTVTGRIDGDVAAAGRVVTITGPVTGGILAAAQ